MQRILIPLPNYGADPTEVAIPWKLLCEKNYHITFTTPEGDRATPDLAMLNGKDLGIWRPLLKTRNDAVAACLDMQQSPAFCKPLPYNAVHEPEFDALLLPGGHAICHGVVLAARSVVADTPISSAPGRYGSFTPGLHSA